MVPLLDPFILAPSFMGKADKALKTGNALGVWARTSEGKPVTGTSWYVNTAIYPDYTNPVTQVRIKAVFGRSA